jgi:hypothetical protein
MWHWKIIASPYLASLSQKKRICCYNFSNARRVNKQAHADWLKRNSNRTTRSKICERKKNCHQYENCPCVISVTHAAHVGRSPSWSSESKQNSFMCRSAGIFIFMYSDFYLSAWDKIVPAEWPSSKTWSEHSWRVKINSGEISVWLEYALNSSGYF